MMGARSRLTYRLCLIRAILGCLLWYLPARRYRSRPLAKATTALIAQSSESWRCATLVVPEVRAASRRTFRRSKQSTTAGRATLPPVFQYWRSCCVANHAKKNNVLASAPHVPMLPMPLRKERSLTRDEAAHLIRASRRAGARYLTLFIRIGIYTGARASAILQLVWDQVDLHTGRIDFRIPGAVETKKRRPNAPINFVLFRALRAARKKSKSTHVIVYRGGPIGLIRKGFLDACKGAKLKGASPHTLKHTAITWLLLRGLTPWQVYGITSTSVATILRVYGHHVQDDLRQAVNAAVGKSALISAERIAPRRSRQCDKTPVNWDLGALWLSHGTGLSSGWCPRAADWC
jgi:integrase